MEKGASTDSLVSHIINNIYPNRRCLLEYFLRVVHDSSPVKKARQEDRASFFYIDVV